MTQFNEAAVRAFPSDVAHTRGIAVKFASGKIVPAANSDDVAIGVIAVDSTAGQDAQVRLRNAQGTGIGLAAAAIAVGDRVVANSVGKLTPTSTNAKQVIGIAITAASGVDVEFEMIMTSHQHVT